MELGGKNAAIVMADANLRRAVEGTIHGAFSSSGQLCVSAERLYVHSDVYERVRQHSWYDASRACP